MKVKNLLEQKENEIISLGIDNSVEDAIRLMHSKKISALIIMHDGKPSGIFTERDVVRAYIAKDGKKFRDMKLQDVMTRNMIVAQHEDQVGDVLATMLQKSIRHMPVAQNGQIVGMLSIRDVVGM